MNLQVKRRNKVRPCRVVYVHMHGCSSPLSYYLTDNTDYVSNPIQPSTKHHTHQPKYTQIQVCIATTATQYSTTVIPKPPQTPNPQTPNLPCTARVIQYVLVYKYNQNPKAPTHAVTPHLLSNQTKPNQIKHSTVR